MNEDLIEKIVEGADEVSELLKETFEFLSSASDQSGKSLDITRPTRHPSGMTADDINIRLGTILDLIGPTVADMKRPTVPNHLISEIATSMENIRNVLTGFSAKAKQLLSNGGIKDIDPENLVVTHVTGDPTINVSKQLLSPLIDPSSVALARLLEIQSIFQIKGVVKSTALEDQLKSQLESARDHDREISTIARATNEVYEDALKQRESLQVVIAQVGESKVEVDRIRNDIEATRKNLIESESEVTAKVASINQINEQAQNLKPSVEAYQSQFDNFQKSLDQRVKQFNEGSAQQDSLIESLKKREAEIEDLNERAEQMLSGATVAGLASSFGQIRDELEGQLIWARRSIYLAFVLLVISVAPLLFFVVPRIDPFGAESVVRSGVDYFAHTTARLLLLLPAAWFARFSAMRHASLFRLREHYAYKYSLAASVEGFKKQAPEYEEQIAFSTFTELTFNPADRMEAKSYEGRATSPVIDELMRRVGLTPDTERGQ